MPADARCLGIRHQGQTIVSAAAAKTQIPNLLRRQTIATLIRRTCHICLSSYTQGIREFASI
jgi:hypothetical protein